MTAIGGVIRRDTPRNVIDDAEREQMKNYFELNDDALVELTLLGDERAFEVLVMRHEGAAISTAYGVTGNRYSAEDAAQDAFISAWMKLDTLSDFAKFRPWLCTIARNCARNLAKHYRATAETISLDAELLKNDIPDLSRDELENEKDLHEMVAALDESVRRIIEMHYFEGYSTAEIAKMLKMPEGTVKWRLSEGRKQLRRGYGALEDYDENEQFVRRVMREVERLKLWRLRDDKRGFADEYRRVLADVVSLGDSPDKDHATADVLVMGLWWIDTVPHPELLERIKRHAEAGGNEEAIAVIAMEEAESKVFIGPSGEQNYDVYFDGLTDYLENVSIPYYKERGHNLAAARLTEFLIRTLISDDDHTEKVRELLDGITDLLDPSYIEYQFAALQRETLGEKVYSAICDDVRVIDGKYCVWESEETPRYYYDGYAFTNFREFTLDGVFFDPVMKSGFTAERRDGVTFTLVSDSESVTVPAGSFDGCRLYRVDVAHRGLFSSTSETWFKPGVGMVMQRYTVIGPETFVYMNELIGYVTNGGGAMPLGRGSRWEYSSCESRRPDKRLVSTLEVTHSEPDRAITKLVVRFVEEYPDTWEGDMLRVKDITDDFSDYWGGDNRMLTGDNPFERAEKRDLTPLQRTHTRVARRAFMRMKENRHGVKELAEKREQNALDGIRVGQWDWFEVYRIKRGDGYVTWEHANTNYDFSCSPFLHSVEGQKIMHNQFLEILSDSTGHLWSEKWVPGYEENYFRDVYGMKGRELRFHFVRDGETVTTPAGTFENCVHIQFDMRDLGALGSPFGWRGGWADYWFARGVGVVQHFRLINNTFDCYWQLTEYRGTGDGYLPAEDGFFRRYEPADLGCGFHSSLELTFMAEGGELYVFADGEGSQDAADYLKAIELMRSEGEAEFRARKSRIFNGIVETAKPIVDEWDPYGLLSDGNKGDDYKRELEYIAREVVFSQNDVIHDPYARNIHPEALERAAHDAFRSSIHPVRDDDPHLADLITAIRKYLDENDD